MGLERETPMMKCLGFLASLMVYSLFVSIGMISIYCDLSHYTHLPVDPYAFLYARLIIFFLTGPLLVSSYLIQNGVPGFYELVHNMGKADPFLENVVVFVAILSIAFYTSFFLYTFLGVRVGRRNKVD
jgi:hypothetical protein